MKQQLDSTSTVVASWEKVSSTCSSSSSSPAQASLSATITLNCACRLNQARPRTCKALRGPRLMRDTTTPMSWSVTKTCGMRVHVRACVRACDIEIGKSQSHFRPQRHSFSNKEIQQQKKAARDGQTDGRTAKRTTTKMAVSLKSPNTFPSFADDVPHSLTDSLAVNKHVRQAWKRHRQKYTSLDSRTHLAQRSRRD